MNQVAIAETTPLEVNYSDIANKYHNADEATVSEYVSDLANQSAANSNDAKPTLFARFVAYMDAWTNASYEAWDKAGKPPRDYL